MSDFHRNTGKPPRDKNAEVSVVWANGNPSRWTYKVSQLVWELRGFEFDIALYRRVA